MKRITTLSFMLMSFFTSAFVFADIQNGDFENWTGGQPDNWTTIDSGISVSQSTQVAKVNSSSAKVTVNTGSQSSTDFRQSIDVTGGQSYTFSVWVYHTEGGVKARLYVDGYRNYSSSSLTNQWQQISYNYTPSSSKSIEVGLRFYDVSGFDGSEIVYVDDYQPTTSTTPPPPPPTGCSGSDFVLDLTTDNYGYETSWSLTEDATQVEVASGSGYASANQYQETACLADGDYTFTILDSYGDGICCAYGSGSYAISLDQAQIASGGSFASQAVHSFTVGTSTPTPDPDPTPDPGNYYASIGTQTGYALKTALHNLIKDHTVRGYSALWDFYAASSLDIYYENDGSILDIYSENPTGADSYNYTKISDQCGTYNSEADCYNREHSFPRSWFGGSVEPMNSDVHHIFASDGFVNSKRSSFPYAVVGSTTFTSSNGSRLGSSSTTGYSGTVFEPIDEFKGDLARAYFYMATRYENVIASWQNNSSSSDAVLDGTSNHVFETWQLNLLMSWHNADPVSQQEIDRNEAAFQHQGNRNPFIDHPEWVEQIWVN